MKLTMAQYKALECLAQGPQAPSNIGLAMTGGLKRSGRPMAAQGLGRLGGAMGARLVRMGLAYHSRARSDFPCYEISGSGRDALATKEPTT